MIPGTTEGRSDGQNGQKVVKVRFYFFVFDLVGGGKILNGPGEYVQCLEVLGLYITHG